jgi:hypothetical protein
MKRKLWLVSVTLLVAVAEVAGAAQQSQVEAVTLPAWLVRAGLRVPLAPSTRLRDGDTVITGADARVRLRLPDGSSVKLGERARFSPSGTGVTSSTGVFRATLRVLEGAFRFTTARTDRYQGKRDVQVRFTTVTVGIRGTDLWGKTTADREIVALIEGRVELTRQGEAPVTMDRAGTWYQALHGAPAAPVEPIPAALLQQFAQETEIPPDGNTLSSSGRWRLTLLDAASEAEALALHDRLHESGYPAALQPLGSGNYRLLLDGLESESNARRLGDRLAGQFGLRQPGISRR